MQFKALADSGLGVSGDDIASVFEPFVERHTGNDDPQWRQEVSTRRRKILRKFLRRMALGWMPDYQRGQDNIQDEYEEVWQAGHERYSEAAKQARYSLWEWRGENMFASNVGATRVRQLLLCRAIEQVKPKRVLEVGCGDGINLILLQSRFPEIEFTGVDLTETGPAAARAMQEKPEIDPALQQYAPLPVRDPTAFRKIRFMQGDATDLPFDDGEFDLVITVLALEQMERVRHAALAQITRVSNGHVLMLEPFREVNNTGWPLLNVLRRNYFRGRIADLKRYGLEQVLALNDYPQEEFLKTCMVLARKKGA